MFGGLGWFVHCVLLFRCTIWRAMIVCRPCVMLCICILLCFRSTRVLYDVSCLRWWATPQDALVRLSRNPARCTETTESAGNACTGNIYTKNAILYSSFLLPYHSATTSHTSLHFVMVDKNNNPAAHFDVSGISKYDAVHTF